jgi:KDO2-lipid IV(A) lauroyltransferase
MNERGVILGLLADQHAGDHGLRVPFFGRECSTSAAPAVFARRYDCRLYVAVCYRVALAKWRIELIRQIPVQEDGRDRKTVDIARDMNEAFEGAIRRDPANWFWVHNRWKPLKPRQTAPSAASAEPADEPA